MCVRALGSQFLLDSMDYNVLVADLILILKCLAGPVALPWLPVFVSISPSLLCNARCLPPPSVNTGIPNSLGLGAAEKSFEESSAERPAV